jgi:hypothetical protein
VIQLTRRGLAIEGAADVDRLANTFARISCVTLKQFVEPLLLKWIASAVEGATFVPRVHDDVEPPATDLWLSDHQVRSTMLLLFNDRTLFEFIQRLAGCPPIGCFIGSTYRMMAELNHHDGWHDDIHDGRMVALSLNLSPNGYRGGLLQIRDKASGTIVHEVANTGFGDAIVFRLGVEIEHRVTDVESGPAKTAYAGWFQSHPSRTTFLVPAQRF